MCAREFHDVHDAAACVRPLIGDRASVTYAQLSFFFHVHKGTNERRAQQECREDAKVGHYLCKIVATIRADHAVY